jgi:hypothetical protein
LQRLADVPAAYELVRADGAGMRVAAPDACPGIPVLGGDASHDFARDPKLPGSATR